MAGGGGGFMAQGLEKFWCTRIVAGPRVYTPPPFMPENWSIFKRPITRCLCRTTANGATASSGAKERPSCSGKGRPQPWPSLGLCMTLGVSPPTRGHAACQGSRKGCQRSQNRRPKHLRPPTPRTPPLRPRERHSRSKMPSRQCRGKAPMEPSWYGAYMCINFQVAGANFS